MTNIVKNIISPKEFTGWHMLGIISLFFGTIISVNLVLAYNASATWTGLVVKNSYVASQFFNDTTKDLEQQQAIGWQGQLDYADSKLQLALLDANGNAIDKAIVTGKIGHPSFDRDDQNIAFTQINDSYIATTQLTSGIWQLDVTASTPEGQKWTKAIRIIVKD